MLSNIIYLVIVFTVIVLPFICYMVIALRNSSENKSNNRCINDELLSKNDFEKVAFRNQGDSLDNLNIYSVPTDALMNVKD